MLNSTKQTKLYTKFVVNIYKGTVAERALISYRLTINLKKHEHNIIKASQKSSVNTKIVKNVLALSAS